MQIKKYAYTEIRRLRLELNLRQLDLSHIMGVPIDVIHRLEHGHIYSSHARLSVYAICITLEKMLQD